MNKLREKCKRPSRTDYRESSLSTSSVSESENTESERGSSDGSLKEGFVKRSRRKRKEVNYQFNDYDETIYNAVLEGKTSDWDEENEERVVRPGMK